tara:strand:- start:183 stop:2789 length:2607 start_codon:yes stop_codon:yes gene_type:complete
MATSTHVGDTRALIFPVMCDGHLKIEYDDYNSDNLEGSNTLDESKHPLWDYGGPFSIEAIVTPYDINGAGHRTSGQGRVDSTKTPPSPNLTLDDHADTTSNYESVSYFGAGRNSHKMMIFSNSYLKFYLQNTTSSNFNQPSEYKMVVELTDSVGTPITHTIDTDGPVFVSKKTMHGYYDANNPSFYDGISTSLRRLSESATAAFDQASIQVTGNLTNFTNTAAVPPTLGTGTIEIDAVPSTVSGAMDVGASAATNATAKITFSSGWSPTPITASTAPSDNNAIILRNRQTGSGTSANKTYRFFYIDNSSSSGFPSEMQGAGARISDLNGMGGMTGGGLIAATLTDAGYTSTDVFVPEVGLTSSGSNQQFRFMLTQAINAFNGVGSDPSSGLDIDATTVSLTSGNTGVIVLTQDASGPAGNHSTTPNTGPVIGSNIAGGSKLTAITFGDNSSDATIIVGADAVSGTTVDAKITIAMRGTSGSLQTRLFKFVASGVNGQAISGTSPTVYRVREASNTSGTATQLRNAINTVFGLHSQFDGTQAAVGTGSNTNVVTITSPATGTQSSQSITATSNYGSVVTIGSSPFSNFVSGSSAITPTAFISLTDTAGNTIRYKPSKGDNSETTGSTGTENSGVTYFLVNASDNAATAANLRSAILNNSNGHAQFSPALTTSISTNTVTITATAASGSHALANTGISSGLSLTNFTGGSGNSLTIGTNETDEIGTGSEIYNNEGVLIGTVSSISGNNITLSAAPATPVTSTLYTEQKKEAMYLEQMTKVGMSFDHNTISLYLNNQLVKKVKVNIGKFRLNNSDCFIGQDGSLNAANRKATQFMGELYEIAFHKSASPCATITTLTPNYSDTLLYYTFGD